MRTQVARCFLLSSLLCFWLSDTIHTTYTFGTVCERDQAHTLFALTRLLLNMSMHRVLSETF
jgi:hypothetical protein